MQEHLSKEEIEGYASRKLPAEQLVAADLHISACSLCQSRLRELEPAGKSPAARGSVTHLTYEEMAAYLDAKMSRDAREAADHHLGSCLLCRQELDDLREFDQVLAGNPAREEIAASFWHTVVAFFRVPERLVAAAAVVLFFAALQRVRSASSGVATSLSYIGGRHASGTELLVLGCFLAAIGGAIFVLNRYSKK
jgi:hypothetical protein